MKTSELITELKKRQLVFTVATGRCGTAFFAEMLRLIPGAESLHEPEPQYAEVLRTLQNDPDVAGQFLLEKKIPTILHSNTNLYIETSHLFCKGFLEPLLDLGVVPSLLWIKREHRLVASSMFKGGTIPGRTEKGLQFYLSPEDQGVLSLPGWGSLHDYQLCFWYCLEIERRAKLYKEMYRKNSWAWAETSLGEITTMRGMRAIQESLDLPKLSVLNWLRYLNNRKRRVNPTSKAKQKIALPEKIEALEQEVLNLVG